MQTTMRRLLRRQPHRHSKRRDKPAQSNHSGTLEPMGPTGGIHWARQGRRVLKGAQRRQPRLAELVLMVSTLVTTRLALRVLLTESLLATTLSKAHQVQMPPHLLRPLVRSAQLIRQLQPAQRHRSDQEGPGWLQLGHSSLAALRWSGQPHFLRYPR